MAKLTEQQKQFADYYIKLGNQREAATRAGYSSPNVRGAQLIGKPQVKAYIDEQLKALQSERIASAEEVLNFLSAVMRGEPTEQIPILSGNGFQSLIDKEPGTKERVRAAELLGKRYSLFTEKLEVEGTAVIKIIDNIPKEGQ